MKKLILVPLVGLVFAIGLVGQLALRISGKVLRMVSGVILLLAILALVQGLIAQAVVAVALSILLGLIPSIAAGLFAKLGL